ncbi:MAG: hypothetical protein J6W96_04475 [Alphaproteobacteria bacterium]|nr:hypothetical protein [Alphaproteobacteria bacterium]
MIKYWWIVLVGAIFALSGCEWEEVTDIRATYPIQNITAYRGQSISSLFDDNGAPNTVDNLEDGRIVWTYYTNYQPVGGGELISYSQPTNMQQGTACSVKVIIYNETVEQVISNCD